MMHPRHFPAHAARLTLIALALSPLVQVRAETTVATAMVAPATVPPTSAATPAKEAPAMVLPVGTEVVLEFVDPVDTDARHAGDVIKLRVATDVMLDGKVAVPAGTPASGEIIHASAHGSFGRAGELVATARFIDMAGGRIPLHAAFGASGTDAGGNSTVGMAVGGLVGGLISGSTDDFVVPAGTRLTARVTGGDPLPASVPTSTLLRIPDVNSPVIGKPESGKGQVVVFRPQRVAASLVNYVLRENDTDLGGVDNGTYLVLSVEPGRHRYEAGKKKDAVTFEVAPGEVYYLMGATVPGLLAPSANVMPVTAEVFAAERTKLQQGQAPSDWQ